MAAAASGTSARGALPLPPLARQLPPAAPRPPRPAGPGRRRRGHVALGPAAAGKCLLSSRTSAAARLLGPGRRGRAGGAEPRGPGAGAGLGRGESGRGAHSSRTNLASEPGTPRPAGGGCFLPALLVSPVLAAPGRRGRERGSRAGSASSKGNRARERKE